MSDLFRKKCFVLSLFVALGLLAACTQVQFTYNNAEVLLRYMITDYVSLRSDQKDDFRARLDRFHAWHRQSELPEYARFAQLASERIAKGLTLEDAQFALTTFRQRYKLLVTHAIDDAVPLIQTLDTKQIAEIDAGFAKSNRKYLEDRKERKSDSAEDRFDLRVERLQDIYKDWLGGLTTAQKARIAEAVKNMPDISSFRYAERVRNQQAFLNLLRSHASANEINMRLRALLAEPETIRDPQYKAAMAASEKMHMQLAVDLSRMATPQQRAHASSRFSGYYDDFMKLSAMTKLAQN